MRRLKLYPAYLSLAILAIIGLVGLRAPSSNIARGAANFIPAFPGAEGFGTTTVGGRGGRVIEITNLNDSGPGSLRACAEATGPRICVFRIAGTIELASRINIWNAFLTIAGQTAPGGGITLKNTAANEHAPMAILTHDVVIRYLRFRPGPNTPPSDTGDALTIVHQPDVEHPDSAVYNVVLDHVSLSWATDEIVNIASDSHDITIQWSIISEGLNSNSPESGPCSSCGMLVSADGSRNITLHHNLFVHNLGRNPHIDTSGVVDVVNNVIFAPGNTAATVLGTYSKFPVNFVGNYAKTYPLNDDGQFYLVKHIGNNLGASIYVQGNIDPNRTNLIQAESWVVDPEDWSYIVGTRHTAPTVTTTSAFAAFDQVLAQAGANQGLNAQGQFFPRRDAVDQRVVNDTINDTSRYPINHPNDVGGWPVLNPGTPYADPDHDGMPNAWENAHNFNPNAPCDNNADADGDGYTNLEEFLNGTDPGQGSGGSCTFVFLPYVLKS